MSTQVASFHPPMFRNNPLGFILSILLITVVGLGVLILLYWFILSRSETLSIFDNKLIFTSGILSKKSTELKLMSIRTINVSQSFFQRIFGTGDLDIFTAGDFPEVALKGMPDPLKLKAKLIGEPDAMEYGESKAGHL